MSDPVYESNDSKYVTFKREDLHQLLGAWSTQNLSVQHPSMLLDGIEEIEVKDAVVIRRQDYYAGPALYGYASSIAIAVKTTDDPKTRASLSAIADYFMRQSELAAEEGWKLPDL